MLPVATMEHYCWIVSPCQTYNSSVSARLSRQINYTERNKTWLFTRLSPTAPLSTHSSVVFDQRIREIAVQGLHLRANVHNDYYFVFVAFQSSFNVLFYTITDLASQHSVQWGNIYARVYRVYRYVSACASIVLLSVCICVRTCRGRTWMKRLLILVII